MVFPLKGAHIAEAAEGRDCDELDLSGQFTPEKCDPAISRDTPRSLPLRYRETPSCGGRLLSGLRSAVSSSRARYGRWSWWILN